MSDTARDRAERLAAKEFPVPLNATQRRAIESGVNLATMRQNAREGYIDGYLARDAEVAAEVAAAKAEAWEVGWETAIEQAPGDVWFDEWHHQTNPYRTERITDDR